MRSSDQEFNRLKVLKTLRRAGPICRTDLARMTDLTGGTITEISGDLVKRALVVEEKVPSGRRGRPRIDLRLNPEGSYALGAFLTVGGGVNCEIVDLHGRKVFSYDEIIRSPASLREWAETIAAIIDRAITASSFPRSEIRRVGLGLPAVIDSERGVVHWLQTYELEPSPVAAIIEEVVGVPVTIDNDTNLLSRAEHWFGDSPLIDDFLLVNIGLGISTSQYRHGQLLAGAHGLNSEWGHMKVVMEGGRPCGCGATGCLLTYSSISGISHAICEMEGRSIPPFTELTDFFADAVARADRGDERIRAIIEQGGRYLGIAMANLINGLDPGRLLLLTPAQVLPQGMSQPFFASLEENILPALRGKTMVEFRSFSDDLFREGSAALVLEQVYRFR